MRRKGFMAKSAALCMAMAMIFTTGCGSSAPSTTATDSKSTSETASTS